MGCGTSSDAHALESTPVIPTATNHRQLSSVPESSPTTGSTRESTVGKPSHIDVAAPVDPNAMLRQALLPNFYRMKNAQTSPEGGGGGMGSVVGDGSMIATVAVDEQDSDDEATAAAMPGWGQNSDDEELDEDEQEETLQMMQDLHGLSVPQAPAAASDAPPADIASAFLSFSSKRRALASSKDDAGLAASAEPVDSSPDPAKRSSRHSATFVPPPAQADVLFGGFYTRRIATSVKKSMASSGLYLTFKDMFAALDRDKRGYITREQWSDLLHKLGLPLESTASLSRIVGLDASSTITLEQFAMVMALSMHGPYLRLMQATQGQNRRQVFLGGEHNEEFKADWRKEQAIPIFTRAGVPFFKSARRPHSDTASAGKGSGAPLSPSQADWNAEQVILEALAKSQSLMMLHVVDGNTRSIASMVEASEHIVSEKEVVLVLKDVTAGEMVAGEKLTPAEAKDLNRGRAYLADVCHRNAHTGVTVFKEVALACEYIVQRSRNNIVRPSLKYFNKPIFPSAPAIAATNTSAASVPALSSSVPLPDSASSASAASLTSTAPPALSTSETTVLGLVSPLSAMSLVASKRRSSQRMSVGAFPEGTFQGEAAQAGAGLERKQAESNAAATVSSPSVTSSVQPAASVAHLFRADEWPLHPQPADYERYVQSAHFSECARIVFKHQVLLTRRAALKVQQQSLQAQAAAGLGLPSSASAVNSLYRSSSLVQSGIARGALASSHLRTASAYNSVTRARIVPDEGKIPPPALPTLRTAESISLPSVAQSQPSASPSGSSRSSSLSTAAQSAVLVRLPSVSTSSSGAADPSLPSPTHAAPSVVPPPHSPTPPAVVAVSDEPEQSPVPTHYLFTMCLRLAEIIQLSTGIVFRTPWPAMVASELESNDAVAVVGDSLWLAQWRGICDRVFRQLAQNDAKTGEASVIKSHLRSASRFHSPVGSTRHVTAAPDLTVSTHHNAFPASSAPALSPQQFLRQMSLHTTPRRSQSDAEQLLATSGAQGTVYQASSRAVAPNSTTAVSIARPKIGLGIVGGLNSSPDILAAEKRAQTSMMVSQVKSRLMAQRSLASKVSPPTRGFDSAWAHSLHAGDLDRLAESLASSRAHDAMVLREMMPAFTGMFSAVAGGKTSCTMDDLSALLEKKLLLPLPSCQSLMAVLELARESCFNESEAHSRASGAAGAGAAVGRTIGSHGGVDAPLHPEAFAPGHLEQPAFHAILSRALHINSSPFSSFLSPSSNFTTQARGVCSKVFLGGSCNPTTWRTDEAIPLLQGAGISFFNPQVDNWSQELVLVESLIKSNAATLLFVIDSETRAIASLIEASEYICSGRDVVLVVKMLGETAAINKEPLGSAQIHALNRARSHVTDLAQRHGLDVFTSISLACEYIVTRIREKEAKEEMYSREVDTFICSEEFVEKSLEEFLRCDPANSGLLDATQLLLACLHLDTDLRPLMPPQMAKHRQPQMEDVERILSLFGSTPSTGAAGAGAGHNAAAPRALDAEQFLQFSRVLFTNVCANVKL